MKSRLQTRSSVPPRRPKSSDPSCLSATSNAGWGPLVGLHLLACLLYLWPGFSPMCSNSFPAAPHHWPATHASPLLWLIICLKPAKGSLPTHSPQGQTRGQERGGDEMSSCASSEPAPLLLQEWRMKQKHSLKSGGGTDGGHFCSYAGQIRFQDEGLWRAQKFFFFFNSYYVIFLCSCLAERFC